jgi:tRNA(adenine34) deaminase
LRRAAAGYKLRASCGQVAGRAADTRKCYPYFRVEPDLQFMQQALEEARSAAAAGEVPIGAVLVRNNEIIARANNRTIRDCDPTAHAEIVALRAAARHFANYRMPGSTLYVTLEPCIMCAGAMIQARIERVVYAADDPKGGAARTCFTALSNPALNHQVPFTAGILAGESAALLQSFFAARR